MKAGFLILLLSALLILPPQAISQAYTTLNLSSPGLAFQGDSNYLNILWNATYSPYTPEAVAAACWLNCPYNSSDYASCPGGMGDIDSVCTAYQNCTYTGVQGNGACVISNPNYNNVSDNNVTCKFFNTAQNIVFEPTNGTFRLIKYRPVVQPGLSYAVGEKMPWRIGVTNLGAFRDSYTINITNKNPEVAKISPNSFNTGMLSGLETAYVYPELLFFSSSSQSTIMVNVTSDHSSCVSDSDCSYLSFQGGSASCETPSKKCRISVEITTKGGFNSLPDFDVSGVLVIIVLSSLLFSVGISRRR